MSFILRRLLHGAEQQADKDQRDYAIRLVFALGNPGKQYAGNRRNVGFWVVDRLARKHGLSFDRKTGTYSMAEGEIGGQRVALAKTRTFNNDSGKAVLALINKLKLDHAREMLIVCDHLDLPTGKVRIRRDGSSGGQKGVADIIAKTKTDAFPRLRVGIGRPNRRGEPTRDPEYVADWVLSDPSPDERRLLDAAVDRAVHAVELAISDGVEAAMNQYNRDE